MLMQAGDREGKKSILFRLEIDLMERSLDQFFGFYFVINRKYIYIKTSVNIYTGNED